MNKLAGKVAPFNPGNIASENLEKLLVGKEKEVSTLVDRVVSAARDGTAPPQQLVIAPRGYGKTHIIQVVRRRLNANKKIGKKLVIAFFKEEEHVHSYLDFLRRILVAIDEKYPDAELKKILENIYGDPSDSSVSDAQEFLDSFVGDRLLVVMVENLGGIFDGLGEDGQKRLRAYLQEARKISLLATAQRLFEPVEVRTFPFYGFFDRTYLEPLNDTETHELLKRLAKLGEKENLLKFLKTKTGKDRTGAVRELTSGNPRLITLFSEFLDEESLKELTGAFMDLIEKSLTPYYQEQMGRLAPLQKRVVEVLCERGDGIPRTVKEIAQRALTTSQSISSQLKKMEELGVLVSKKRGRVTYYAMAEPLWRVSIEVKNNIKNNDKAVLPIVVGFLKIVKPLKELFAGVSKTDGMSPHCQRHLQLALKESLESLKPSDRDQVLTEKLNEILDLLGNPDQAGRLTEVLVDTVNPFWVGAVFYIVFDALVTTHELKNNQDSTRTILELMGRQFNRDQRLAFVFSISHLIIDNRTKPFFKGFWKTNRSVFFDCIASWPESTTLKGYLLDAEAFAGGDSSALAGWPIEFQKIFERGVPPDGIL